MHARAVPVGIAERLAVEFDIDAVALGEAQHQVAGHPHLVGSGLGALAEDLEFPLALRHLGIDAFVVDAGREAEVEVLFDDLARDATDVRVADAGVVRALRRRITVRGETERTAVLVEEIFLLEAEPGAFVIEDGRTLVGGVRGLAIGHHDFAHYQRAVFPRGIRIDSDRLQHAIGAVAFGLIGRRTVEAPERKLFQRRKLVEFLDLRFAAQTRRRRIAVEPNILELVLGH